jgi:hypothetical protein
MIGRSRAEEVRLLKGPWPVDEERFPNRDVVWFKDVPGKRFRFGGCYMGSLSGIVIVWSEQPRVAIWLDPTCSLHTELPNAVDSMKE